MPEKLIFAVPIFIKKWLKYGGKSGKIGKIVKNAVSVEKTAVLAYSQRIFLTFF